MDCPFLRLDLGVRIDLVFR